MIDNQNNYFEIFNPENAYPNPPAERSFVLADGDKIDILEVVNDRFDQYTIFWYTDPDTQKNVQQQQKKKNYQLKYNGHALYRQGRYIQHGQGIEYDQKFIFQGTFIQGQRSYGKKYARKRGEVKPQKTQKTCEDFLDGYYDFPEEIAEKQIEAQRLQEIQSMTYQEGGFKNGVINGQGMEQKLYSENWIMQMRGYWAQGTMKGVFEMVYINRLDPYTTQTMVLYFENMQRFSIKSFEGPLSYYTKDQNWLKKLDFTDIIRAQLFNKQQLQQQALMITKKAITKKKGNKKDQQQQDSSQDLSSSNEAPCSICHNAFEENDYVKRFPCQGKHLYHSQCIDQWLQNQKKYTCPMCKFDLLSIPLSNVWGTGKYKPIVLKEGEQTEEEWRKVYINQIKQDRNYSQNKEQLEKQQQNQAQNQ